MSNFASPCLNRGVCSDASDTYVCSCPDGFSGVDFEITQCSLVLVGNKVFVPLLAALVPILVPIEMTPCSSDPCLNAGVCAVEIDTYVCICPAGFSGTNCKLTPCKTDLFINNDVCVVTRSLFGCVREHNYSGKKCEINPCTVDPCNNGGIQLRLQLFRRI